MKKFFSALSLLFFVGSILLFTGCSSNTKEARTVLEIYLENVGKGEYDDAYDLLCEFDRGNISKDLFKEWHTTVSRITEIGGYTVSSRVDRFKDFEYLGTIYKKAFGFEVECKQKQKITDIKLEAYDKNLYKIMVVKEGNEYRVALLLTNLEDLIQKYKDQIK